MVSFIARGDKRENIIAGIHEAISSRISAMASRLGMHADTCVMMTGGVAKNIGVVKAMEKVLGYPISVSPHAQMTGAIGVACIAAREGR